MSKNTLQSQLWFNRTRNDIWWTLLATAYWLTIDWRPAVLTAIGLTLLAGFGLVHRDKALSTACRALSVLQILLATLILIASHGI